MNNQVHLYSYTRTCARRMIVVSNGKFPNEVVQTYMGKLTYVCTVGGAAASWWRNHCPMI